jgi:hypothetical protein
MNDCRCPHCDYPWPDCVCPELPYFFDEPDVPAAEPDDSAALWLDTGGEG